MAGRAGTETRNYGDEAMNDEGPGIESMKNVTSQKLENNNSVPVVTPEMNETAN